MRRRVIVFANGWGTECLKAIGYGMGKKDFDVANTYTIGEVKEGLGVEIDHKPLNTDKYYHHFKEQK